MRRMIAFDCHGAQLAATLDEGSAPTGLLIVSGGNEIRCGAHRGMARLAADLSCGGTAVFRYDRRGVGDSAGINRGTIAARDDLIAAVAAFRTAAPAVTRIVAYGNCDAAAALALHAAEAGVAALVLANPWLGDERDALPPRAAIRARYRQRLFDPGTWLRLATGAIDLRLAARGLAKLMRPNSSGSDRTVLTALAALRIPTTIVLATGDATAIGFAARWAGRSVHPVLRIPTASHSFAREPDTAALTAAIRAAIA